MADSFGPLIDRLKEVGKYDELAAAWAEFRAPASEGGFDPNPFDSDSDEHEGWVAEIRHDMALFSGLVAASAASIESVCSEVDGLDTDEDKLSALAALIAGGFDVPWVPEAMERQAVEIVLKLILSKAKKAAS